MNPDPTTWDWVSIITWVLRAGPLILAVVIIVWLAVLAAEVHEALTLLRRELNRDDTDPPGGGGHWPPYTPNPEPPTLPYPATVPGQVTIHRIPTDTNPGRAAATEPSWRDWDEVWTR